jgi:hypothetical protein
VFEEFNPDTEGEFTCINNRFVPLAQLPSCLHSEYPSHLLSPIAREWDQSRRLSFLSQILLNELSRFQSTSGLSTVTPDPCMHDFRMSSSNASGPAATTDSSGAITQVIPSRWERIILSCHLPFCGRVNDWSTLTLQTCWRPMGNSGEDSKPQRQTTYWFQSVDRLKALENVLVAVEEKKQSCLEKRLNWTVFGSIAYVLLSVLEPSTDYISI